MKAINYGNEDRNTEYCGIVKRIYTEKKEGHNHEAKSILREIRDILGVAGAVRTRVLYRYDIEGVEDEVLQRATGTILSEPQVDFLYYEGFVCDGSDICFAVEFLPGQYDQRADLAARCIRFLSGGTSAVGKAPEVRFAKVFVIKGTISSDELNRIKRYYINPIECREASLEKPDSLRLIFATAFDGDAVVRTNTDMGAVVRTDAGADAVTCTDADVDAGVCVGAGARADADADVRADADAGMRMDTDADVRADSDADVRVDADTGMRMDTDAVVGKVNGLISMSDEDLKGFLVAMSLAMSVDDLKCCREYFRGQEGRDPTVTEIRMLDAYWSDHCRHTTFLTAIEGVEFEEGLYKDLFVSVYNEYLAIREDLDRDNLDKTLMDIATIAMKKLRMSGKLNDLDVSDEVNACSVEIDVDVDGIDEKWLLMFKNETHNHPTEIEPFGGASTCLGGAIRDPLSGRAHVYQAMRVTGSGDPRAPISRTLPGKLPQRRITTVAADGYSSYGNQIGLASGYLNEIYDERYIAKRMELGALVGAAPKNQVVRETPQDGDVIILLGGRTGRDGIGAATGSSKEQTEDALTRSGSEVQKGNPLEERKIVRFFRDPDVSRMIIRCNDFGAGGVSVAVGELADGIDIDLDKVPVKYEGLDGAELALSESQERMAVVVKAGDKDRFIELAGKENLEAAAIAVVTGGNRLRMKWRGSLIVDISREFLNTSGARHLTDVFVICPAEADELPGSPVCVAMKGDAPGAVAGGATGCIACDNPPEIKRLWFDNLTSLKVCSRKGLVERFDCTAGAGTVLAPFGGKYQNSPVDGMAAMIPVERGRTDTATLMAYGYDPDISGWSPFHGAIYAVLESISRVVAMGGDIDGVKLTFQEYFEKPGEDPKRWGKPFAALLGAFYAQMRLEIAAIGGKDSMSGTFRDIDVPPTLVSFAVTAVKASRIISPEFKKAGGRIYLLEAAYDENKMPDFDSIGYGYKWFFEQICEGHVISAMALKCGGVSEAVSKMCFGNMLGVAFDNSFDLELLFKPLYGSILFEADESLWRATQSGDCRELEKVGNIVPVGVVLPGPVIRVSGVEIYLGEALDLWMNPLLDVFPVGTGRGYANYRTDLGAANYQTDAGAVDYRADTGTANCSTSNGAANYQTDAGAADYRADVRASTSDEYIDTVGAQGNRTSRAKPKVAVLVFPGTNGEYDAKRAFEDAGAEVRFIVAKDLAPSDIDLTVKNIACGIRESKIIVLPGGFSGYYDPVGASEFTAALFSHPRVIEAVLEHLYLRDGLMLGIGAGFQALIKLGLLPYGTFLAPTNDSPALAINIGGFISRVVYTVICDNPSPWLSLLKPGQVCAVPVAHGEGRFIAGPDEIEIMFNNRRIATRYVDFDNEPTMMEPFNPNGSVMAVEGVTSPDGRILGRMGHIERTGHGLLKNIYGDKNNSRIFEAGVRYFT